MANRFLKLKMRFRHLRRRVWSGKRANRARFSWSPTSHFGIGVQRRLPFLQDIILKNCRHTPVFSKSVSDAIYSNNRPHFRMRRRYIAGILFLIFCLRQWRHCKIFERCPLRKGRVQIPLIKGSQVLWEERAQFGLSPGVKHVKARRK